MRAITGPVVRYPLGKDPRPMLQTSRPAAGYGVSISQSPAEIELSHLTNTSLVFLIIGSIMQLSPLY